MKLRTDSGALKYEFHVGRAPACPISGSPMKALTA